MEKKYFIISSGNKLKHEIETQTLSELRAADTLCLLQQPMHPKFHKNGDLLNLPPEENHKHFI